MMIFLILDYGIMLLTVLFLYFKDSDIISKYNYYNIIIIL